MNRGFTVMNQLVKKNGNHDFEAGLLCNQHYHQRYHLWQRVQQIIIKPIEPRYFSLNPKTKPKCKP